jgi:geranylgeranyl diphosphate synthase, type I
MLTYLAPLRERIAATLTGFFAEKKSWLARVNPLGPDAGRRLLEFALQGKMIRGCLVQLGYSLARESRAGSEPPESVLMASSAMELFQSGLLVHDDIMDRDILRRGKPSIFRQYAEEAERGRSADPPRTGEALGICAGDVAYFLAFELLSRVAGEPAALREVLALCARELAAVGIAQMQDVSWGGSKIGVTDAEILRMYTWKTGRYSFSLPLMVGSLIGGAPAILCEELEKLGECMGLLFQIHDDELGLFGSEQELGKPVGSDVREGKKTLYYARLMAAASPQERERLDRIFGNPGGTAEDLDYVRSLSVHRGVRDGIVALSADLQERTRSIIARLSRGTREDRQALLGLLDFTTARRQ